MHCPRSLISYFRLPDLLQLHPGREMLMMVQPGFLAFQLVFYGATYSNLYIGTNGYLSLVLLLPHIRRWQYLPQPHLTII